MLLVRNTAWCNAPIHRDKCSATNLLCDTGQIYFPLWALLSPFKRRGLYKASFLSHCASS